MPGKIGIRKRCFLAIHKPRKRLICPFVRATFKWAEHNGAKIGETILVFLRNAKRRAIIQL
jgi:hypothetical protein